MQTHKEFSELNQQFIECCKIADLEPTKRQATKFKRKFGKAYEIGLPLYRATHKKRK